MVLTRVGALNLNAGDDFLLSGVIDTTNGFAYFGTDDTPGRVIKVKLSDFTEVGSIILNAGEDGLYTALIDTVNGFAYFTTGASFFVNVSPTIVIKIDLSTFTRVGAITFPATEGYTRNCGAIDVPNQLAYIGTDEVLGFSKVVKVDLSTFTRVGSLPYPPIAGDYFNRSAAIDLVNGFLYIGSLTTPATIFKIRLSDFTVVGSLTFSAPADERTLNAVIDTINGFLYFSCEGVPGRIVKVRLSDFTEVGSIALGAGENNPYGACIAPALNGGYAFFGCDVSPGKVAKIRLSDFTRVEGITLEAAEKYADCLVADPANGNIYVGAYNTQVVVKLNDPDIIPSAAAAVANVTGRTMFRGGGASVSGGVSAGSGRRRH